MPGVPVPRRQTVIVPPVSEGDDKAIGQRGKDQGLGGFPGPIQLFLKFAEHYAPPVYRYVERLFTEHRKNGVRKNSFKWLAGDFQNLIINRNSDFDTDELTDEELEQLGGIEYVLASQFQRASLRLCYHYRYRALDFLSWLVILVSSAL